MARSPIGPPRCLAKFDKPRAALDKVALQAVAVSWEDDSLSDAVHLPTRDSEITLLQSSKEITSTLPQMFRTFSVPINF
jgi:hypothetical protein